MQYLKDYFRLRFYQRIKMNTVKLHLKPTQSYIGGREYGKVKENIGIVVHGLLKGTIKVQKQTDNEHETLTCRLDDKTLYKLTKIAQKNKISLQELLREGLLQLNLISQE